MSEIHGEKVLAKLRPHPLAFAGDMALWIYTILAALLVWVYRARLAARLEDLPLLGRLAPAMVEGWGPLALTAILVIAPALLYSVFRVTWRPLAQALVVVLLPPLAAWKLGYGPFYGLLGVIGLALLGLLGVELKRRRHLYIVTDRRIKTVFKGLFKEVERDIVYTRLSDVVVEKGLLGKILGFGNVYIISQASLGMGADIAGVAVGAGGSAGPAGVGVAVGGGRSVNVPRSRSQYVLYGVPHPERVSSLIVEAMKSSEEAPYLQKILEKLDRD